MNLIKLSSKYASAEVTLLDLVQNWFEELKRFCSTRE